MSNIAIRVEDLGKQYRLGEIGTGTLSHDLNRWWSKVRGKEDPFAKVGEANDRTTKGTSDYVWSLKDVNFEVKAGEVLGIIGRNGAGKSTLLKILSKVTAPTTGRIKVQGRIASLLEVGTGFHPDLTGRENVYLNGAILGMSKSEISRKFDEIVDFSGVERYIDTPVKRYSSGMYVRLAFAVSAFLEPEILIVDEVLAVGDAEFQKKCLGRMKDVSVNDGRTVLFVSHNMGAVSQLCTQGLFLKNGQVIMQDEMSRVIEMYVNEVKRESVYRNEIVKTKTHFETVGLTRSGIYSNGYYLFSEEIVIEFKIRNVDYIQGLHLSVIVKDQLENPIFSSHVEMDSNSQLIPVVGITASIPAETLLPGHYIIEPVLHVPNKDFIDNSPISLGLNIEDTGSEHSAYLNADFGKVSVGVNWSF